MPESRQPRVVRSFHPALDAAVKELVLANREKLIKATVSDPNDQKELIELNKRINALRAKNPDIVGAWGLGCGAGCRPTSGALGVWPPPDTP